MSASSKAARPLLLGHNQFALVAALYLAPERSFDSRREWAEAASSIRRAFPGSNELSGPIKAQPSVLRRALVVTKRRGSAKPVWLSLRGVALCEGRIAGAVRFEGTKEPVSMARALARLATGLAAT
ncbi:MAG TPA: hypothetical protein DFS52_19390 [Myxococcales bacterium]|nr:hypothetical protein [Myxococcales bacterium]